MTVGFALAIALLEIVAGLFPAPEKQEQGQTVVATLVTIRRRTPPPPTPSPAPKVTPKPTPPPTPAPHNTPAPRVVVRAPALRAAATPRRLLGGAAAPRHVIFVTPYPLRPASPRPAMSLANTRSAGQQSGGAGTGAGAGNGDGGAGGTGSGSGSRGNGNGSDSNSAPCGTVTFFGRPDHFDPDGTGHEHVRVEIRLADGTVMSDELHWLWTYKSEADNPFDPSAAEEPVPMQLPPAGYDLGRQAAATILVLKHTSSSGTTLLPECPS